MKSLMMTQTTTLPRFSKVIVDHEVRFPLPLFFPFLHLHFSLFFTYPFHSIFSSSPFPFHLHLHLSLELFITISLFISLSFPPFLFLLFFLLSLDLFITISILFRQFFRWFSGLLPRFKRTFAYPREIQTIRCFAY